MRDAALVAAVSEVAAKAGHAILRWYKQNPATRKKSDKSPVTDADIAAHELIHEALTALTPGVRVLSEEGGGDTAAIPMTENCFWVVDPLDGTRDFLAGTDEFTVNIALVESGKPIFGVIEVPVTGVIYAGGVFTGATRRDNVSRIPSPISVRRISRGEMHVLVSRFHRQNEVAEVEARFPGCRVTPMGSSLKYVHLAEGAADLSWRRSETKIWDTAAANAILAAAGGIMRCFDGSPLRYDSASLTHPGFVAIGDTSVDWSWLTR